MSKYRKSYLILWSAISDAINDLEVQNYGTAKLRLLEAQKNAEEAFIDWEEEMESVQNRDLSAFDS